jgi:hypothetical protein
MARGNGSFHFEGDLTARINTIGPKVKRAMVAAAGYTATAAEQYMKDNAPWTDRTGAARNGLGSQVVVNRNFVSVVLYHSVPYGPFLELRWDGKYAIIEPTMAAAGPLFVEMIGRLAFKEV